MKRAFSWVRAGLRMEKGAYRIRSRVIFCFIALIFLMSSLYYPIIPSEAVPIKDSWVNTYGDGKTAHATQTEDGGFVIVGTTDDGSYLIKTNTNGIQQWIETWDFHYMFNDVKQTSDGGYIICGVYSGPVSNMEGLLLKTDSSGVKIWENYYYTLGLGTFWELKSVQETTDGGFIAGGSRYKPPEENFICFVVKTDASGNNQWEPNIESPNVESIECIRQTSDGGYISVGVYDVQPLEGDPIFYSGLCKRDSAGNIIWDKHLSEGDWEASSVLQTKDRSYVLSCSGTVNLIKMNGEGEITWQKSYGSYSMNMLDQTKDGGFILAGSIGSAGCIVKVHKKGTFQWEVTYPNTNLHTVESIKDGYVAAGISNGEIFLTKLFTSNK
jgi:hypothetical protein